MTKKTENKLENFAKAVDRLKEAFAEKTANSLAVDGTIRRFKIGFELCWKTLKDPLKKIKKCATKPTTPR